MFDKPLWFSIGMVAGACLVGLLATGIKAWTDGAVHAEDKTIAWDLGIPLPVGGPDLVTVVDAGGVCLYVLTGAHKGGIAAVSKTQMGAGRGCQ